MSSRPLARLSSVGLLATGLCLAAAGCTVLVDTDVKKGVGAFCEQNSECQGESALCTEGVCTTGCTSTSECPEGAVCVTGEQRCHQPLKVGAIYIGNAGEGWTKTHADGLAEVQSKLGYLDIASEAEVFNGQPTTDLVERYIAEGRKVIVATSTSYDADIRPLAEKHPDVKFLVCEGHNVTANLGSYYGRREQAWYVAGFVAASKSATKKLGIIGSFVSPDTVRNINAFLLGARSSNADVTVEVRWSGFWFDYTGRASFGDNDDDGTGFCTNDRPCFLEEYLTDKLIAGGVDVVTHQTDVDRSITFVERYNPARPDPANTPQVFSIANNNRYGCFASGVVGGTPHASCLTAVYWNWTPFYTQLFSQIHQGQWKPANEYKNIETNVNTSIVGLQQSELGGRTVDPVAFEGLISSIASEAQEGRPYAIFSSTGPRQLNRAPYNTNDRPAGPVNAPLTEDEVATMCWFAEGVVEQPSDACSENPKGPGCAVVPAKVPRGDRSPWKALPPFGETGHDAFSCVAHGGR